MRKFTLPKIFPEVSILSKFQREEYAKLWFDLAKLCFASLILKIFEPGSRQFDSQSSLTIIFGLTGFLLCAKFGLYIAKEKNL